MKNKEFKDPLGLAEEPMLEFVVIKNVLFRTYSVLASFVDIELLASDLDPEDLQERRLWQKKSQEVERQLPRTQDEVEAWVADLGKGTELPPLKDFIDWS